MFRRSKMNLNAWRIVDRPAPDEPVTATMGRCWDMIADSPWIGQTAADGKCTPAHPARNRIRSSRDPGLVKRVASILVCFRLRRPEVAACVCPNHDPRSVAY